MEIIKISALILAGAALISCIPAFDRHIHTVITIAVCMVVAVYVINALSPAVERIRDLIYDSATDNFDTVFKVLGVGLLTQFVSDIASDSGNKALSQLMIFAGKATCLVIAMPLFLQVLQVIRDLVRGA